MELPKNFLKKIPRTYSIILWNSAYRNDFRLFDLIKKNLDDHNDFESQKNYITKQLQSVPKEQEKNERKQ